MTDEIRDYYRARADRPRASLAVAYYGPGYPGIVRWSVTPYGRSPAVERQIAWEAAGTSTFDGVVIDKYVLHHSGGLSMPLLHLHGEGAGRHRVVLWVSDRGKADANDWNAMQALIANGNDVVSFDPRGLGETRMRYTAMSIDDPTLAAQDSIAHTRARSRAC